MGFNQLNADESWSFKSLHFTYVSSLCKYLQMFIEGKSVHFYTVKDLSDSDSGYAFIRCMRNVEQIDNVKLVLKSMDKQNRFSWTVIIFGYRNWSSWRSSLINMYASCKQGIQDAWQLFSSMKKRDTGRVHSGSSKIYWRISTFTWLFSWWFYII